MKLMYLSHFRFPSEKAHSGFAMKTCEAFADAGVTVELWAPRRANRAFHRQDAFAYHGARKNFRIRYLPVIDLMSVHAGPFSLALLVASYWVSVFCAALLSGHLRRAVFYCHDSRDLVLLALFRPTIVLEIHDFFESEMRWISRWVFPRVTAYISTNTLKVMTLTTRFHIPRDRILVEQNAVDPALFCTDISKSEARRALGLPREKKLVVYTGHLYPWKGVFVLAAASRYLQSTTDVHILFVGGTSEDQQRLTLYIAKEHLEHITVRAHEPQSRMPLFLRAADVLVLPNSAKSRVSAIETSPMKLFEYLASGRPIVATDVPAVREIVSEKEVRFCPPDDPQILADTLQECLQALGEAEVRSEAGKKIVLEHTWEQRAERILAFLRARALVV